jgi:hypothetical protein
MALLRLQDKVHRVGMESAQIHSPMCKPVVVVVVLVPLEVTARERAEVTVAQV